MLIFFGTSHRSALFLNSALQNGLKVDLVVSEPAKKLGRQQILTENPTITAAKKLKIPSLSSIFDLQNPSSVFPARHASQLAGVAGRPPPTSEPTLGLMLDFNQIIPPKIIALFPKGIINIHFSKLPQYRGPAPVQQTILNGDQEAWLSYYLITSEVDGGPILAQTSLPLDFTETTDSLYEKLIDKAAQEAPKVISDYLSDRVKPCQQTGMPTSTKKLTTQNCQIDWTKSPEEIDRLIRTAYREPGAWTEVELKANSLKLTAKRLKILKAHLEKGKLVLDQVQLEGKNPVSWPQFQEGYPEAKII